MSKRQKITGIVVDGVIYNFAKSQKPNELCINCDLQKFCNKNIRFCSFCLSFAEKGFNLKRQEQQ